MEVDSLPVSEAGSPRSGCQRFGSSLRLLEEATFSLCPHLDRWSLCVQMFSSCKDAGQIGSGLTPTASLILNPSLKALVHRMSTEGKKEATGLGKDKWNRTDGQELRELRTSQVGRHKLLSPLWFLGQGSDLAWFPLPASTPHAPHHTAL